MIQYVVKQCTSGIDSDVQIYENKRAPGRREAEEGKKMLVLRKIVYFIPEEPQCSAVSPNRTDQTQRSKRSALSYCFALSDP
jgi:hypothetical protein